MIIRICVFLVVYLLIYLISLRIKLTSKMSLIPNVLFIIMYSPLFLLILIKVKIKELYIKIMYESEGLIISTINNSSFYYRNKKFIYFYIYKVKAISFLKSKGILDDYNLLSLEDIFLLDHFIKDYEITNDLVIKIKKAIEEKKLVEFVMEFQQNMEDKYNE